MAETSISGIEFQIKGATGKAASSVDKLTSSLRSLKGALQTGSTGKLKKDMDDIDKSAKKADTTLGKLAKSIGRIAFYRAIRSAIRFVTDGFKEGLENAYQFSKVVGYELADTLDRLATKGLTMKNQLGSAFGGLIMAVEPILLQLIGLVTRAANALAQLMAIIGGRTTYLKAIDTVTEYGEAIGGAGQAAKEAMKYLAPFDELNRLPGDNGSSGGGGSNVPDYSAMFEETPVAQALQDFVTDFKISVSDVLFDWSDLTGEQIAEKVLAGLFMLTGAGVGFILGGVPGALIGSIIGLTLGLVADTFVFDHDGVLEQSEIAHGLQYVLNALAGGVIGFMVGGPGGALIGASVGLGLSLLADSAQLLPGEGRINRDVLLDQMTVALGVLTGAVLGFTVGGPAGALIGAVVGLGITATITALKFDKTEGTLSGESGRTGLDYFIVDVLGLPSDEQWREWGSGIWEKISDGVSAGWHWLTDGFKDIGTELYNIFIKPIVDTWNDFIANHPKIAKLLGLSQESGSAFPNNGETFSFDVEGTITDIKDNIPTEKKTLKNFIAGLFGTKDEIPAADKKTSGWQAVLNSFTPKFASGAADSSGRFPLLSAVANLSNYWTNFGSASPTSGSDKKTPLIASVANMSNYQTKFASGTADKNGKFPLFASVAKFTTRQDGLTDAQKQFNTRGNFMYRNDSLTDAQKTFNSKANFTSNKTGWSSSPVLSAIASFISGSAGWKDNPYLSAVASFVDYADNIEGTPTIACKGVILDYETNNPGYVMGSYAKGGAFYGGSWHDIPQAASGGKFHGTMFWAGENGPEVVGHAGGRTEVLNRSQLAATMYAAVSSALSGIQMRVTGMGAAPMTGAGDESMSEDVLYRAMLRALNDSDNDRPIELDGDIVYRKMVNRNRANTRVTGVNALAG